MDKRSQAIEKFNRGYLCSQAVLGTFCEAYGLDDETAMRLAQGFGGGFGRCGETCGAVTGALMVLGLKEGSAAAGNTPEKVQTYASVNTFIERFKKRHGSIICKVLLHCDINQSEGYERACEQNLFQTVCPALVGSSAEILDAMLQAAPDASENDRGSAAS